MAKNMPEINLENLTDHDGPVTTPENTPELPPETKTVEPAIDPDYAKFLEFQRMQKVDAAAPSPISPRKTMSDILFVTDTTATAENPTRVHEQMVGGKREKFTFTYGTQLKMPRAVAMKFAKTEAFIVNDEDGNRVLPIVTHPFINGVKKIDLGIHQCIADFSELTDEALLIRCQQSNGGEVMTRDNSRAQCIDFLVATRLKFEESLKVAKLKPQSSDNVASDGEFEGGISKDVLDKMLGGLGKELNQIAVH